MFDNNQQPQQRPGGFVPPQQQPAAPRPAQPMGNMAPRPAMPGPTPMQPNQMNRPQAEPEDIFAGINSNNQRSAAPAYMPQEKSGTGRKILLVLLALIIVALLITGGVFAYLSFLAQPSQPNTNVTPNVNNVNQEPEINTNEIINEEPEMNTNEEPEVNENMNEEPEVNINEGKAGIPSDLDADGLTDEEEATLGTDPMKSDTDSDGLTDREEVMVYKTNPADSDTDKDTYPDGEEVKNGYNPLGTGKLFVPPLE